MRVVGQSEVGSRSRSRKNTFVLPSNKGFKVQSARVRPAGFGCTFIFKLFLQLPPTTFQICRHNFEKYRGEKKRNSSAFEQEEASSHDRKKKDIEIP